MSWEADTIQQVQELMDELWPEDPITVDDAVWYVAVFDQNLRHVAPSSVYRDIRDLKVEYPDRRPSAEEVVTECLRWPRAWAPDIPSHRYQGGTFEDFKARALDGQIPGVSRRCRIFLETGGFERLARPPVSARLRRADLRLQYQGPADPPEPAEGQGGAVLEDEREPAPDAPGIPEYPDDAPAEPEQSEEERAEDSDQGDGWEDGGNDDEAEPANVIPFPRREWDGQDDGDEQDKEDF